MYTNAYFFHLVYSRTYSVSFPSMLKQARFRGKGGTIRRDVNEYERISWKDFRLEWKNDYLFYEDL